MTRTTNSDIERHYFEQLRRDFELPPGSIEYADKPDIRIMGDRVIGIEVARLYLRDGTDPESEQRQSQLRTKVLAEAQALYLSAGGRQIELHVDFDPAHSLTATSVLEVAQKLAAFAREIDQYPATYSGDLAGAAAGFRYVHHNGVEYETPRWLNPQVFTTPPLDTERLAKIVEEKTRKAEAYVRCDELWLLLIVDFMNPAQDQDLLALPDAFCLPSGAFHQVLVYKPQFRQVVRVTVAPPSSRST